MTHRREAKTIRVIGLIEIDHHGLRVDTIMAGQRYLVVPECLRDIGGMADPDGVQHLRHGAWGSS
ncbi:hypothetical protein [Gordonia sp. NPDC003950]